MSSSSLCIRVIFLNYPAGTHKAGTFSSSSSLCIRIVSLDHSTNTKKAPSLPRPLRLSVSASLFQTILRVQSRHLFLLFVSLYLYRLFKPCYGYKVGTFSSSSSSSLCICIVILDHPTDTKQTSHRPRRFYVSVSFLQTNIRIISRHLIFHFLFASLYSYRLFNQPTE